MMQEYSKRLGQISQDQFQAALARLSLGDFVKAEPIPFGLFGQNVFLTSTQGEFVFRGAPHYPWQFPTEQFFVDKLHERTRVPVPFPYRMEPTSDIFGWSFAIMPRMPGRQVQDRATSAQWSSRDRVEIARALAHMLVEIQTLTWEYAGEYDLETGTIDPFPKHYRDWIVDGIPEKAAQAQSYNAHTTPSDLDWIESVIAKARPGLQIAYQPCVVIGDYGEHNTVVLQTDGTWQISGLFDLMTAHMGDGQADLSLHVTAYLKANEPLADVFVSEYLHWKPVQPGFVEHQQLYMLDLLMSFWRYWQRHQNSMPGEPESLSFEQWARPSVDYWNKYARQS